MTKRPLLAARRRSSLLPACGHKGDPLPPLRRTPPAPADFRLAQRGDVLELLATAPAASVDGVAYDRRGVEFLYGTGEADLEKRGQRRLAAGRRRGSASWRRCRCPRRGRSCARARAARGRASAGRAR